MKRATLFIASVIVGSATVAWIVASQPVKAPAPAKIDTSAGKIETWTFDGLEASPVTLAAATRVAVKGSLKTDFKRWSQSLDRTKGLRESKAERQKRLESNPPTLQVWVFFVHRGLTGDHVAASSLMNINLKPDGRCTFAQSMTCPESPGEYEVRVVVGEYNSYAYGSMLDAPRHVIATARAVIVSSR